MAKTIPLSLVCLISSFTMMGCLHRAESVQMLEVRADYVGKSQAEAESLKLSDRNTLREVQGGVPLRTPPKIAHIWIFAHETPSKEYFWGGWISVVVEGDQWEVERPAGLFPDKPGQASLRTITRSLNNEKVQDAHISAKRS